MGEVKRSKTLATDAYERLRQDIIRGEFPFGKKLPVRTICDRYGVGLAPAREALNRASYEQLIVQTDLRGFTVAALSEEDMADVLDIRGAINEMTLRRSIESGDDEWEESVVVAYHRMMRRPFDRANITDEWERAHRAFHASLLAGCGSDRLIRYCDQLCDAWNRYRFLARAVIGQEKGPSGDHPLIMKATINREADKAVELLTDHFTRTADHCRRALRQLADETSSARENRKVAGAVK